MFDIERFKIVFDFTEEEAQAFLKTASQGPKKEE